MAKNGMGGLDWAGVPMLAGWLGVQDVDGLLDRLCVMCVHRTPKEG